MHDGILFERMGIPTAVIITEPFIPTARAIAELEGMADYEAVVAPHPITSRSDDDLRRLARLLAAHVEGVLLGWDAPRHEVGADDAPDVTVAEVDKVLAPYRDGLRSDGADLVAAVGADGAVDVRLVIGDETCTDCIMAPATVGAIVERLLEGHFKRPLAVAYHDPRS